jgi:O-antigen/teichoic acid export membrane protein
VLFATALPLTLGQRILLGAGKNHVAVAASIVQPVAALTLALALYAASAPADAYVLTFAIANLVSVLTMSALARRLVGIRTSLRGAADVRVLPIALPMFLITVGIPLSLQSDKIVISHQLDPTALAEYALAFQLYAPGYTVLSTAALALLPVFVRRRAHGLAFRRLWLQVTVAFAGIAVVGGVVYVVATPLVAGLVADERISLPAGLRWAFAGLLIVQISGFVSSTLLNRPREMARQATAVLNMTVANLGLSWVLAERIGVAGPVVASAITMGLLLVLPQIVAGWRLRES